MKKIVSFLILSCLKATELIEKKQLFDLKRGEAIQLKIHKLVCVACANYEKQSDLLDSTLKRIYKKSDFKLESENLKQSIIVKLGQKSDLK